MKFIDLVQLMAQCNDVPMRRNINFNNLNITMLDNQSERLSINEVDLFIDGERDEALKIIDKHGCDELDAILDKIFIGELYDDFFVR